MKKRMLSLLLTVAMGVSLVACGSSSSSTTESASTESSSSTTTTTEAAIEAAAESTGIAFEDLKIGVVMKSFDEFQQAAMDGAEETAIAAGVKAENITIVAPNSESEIMAQVTAVEDMISKKIDILLIDVNQPDTVMNVLQQAHDAGIIIVTIDTDAPDFDNKVTYIGTDNEDAAYTGGLEYLATLEPNSNVVILRGKLGDVNHEARTLGLTNAIEEMGHTLLEVQDANCESDKAATAMEAFMTKYPGQIDAVMVTSDSMAVGAAQAIKAAGISDDISICGFDGFQSAIDLIETGEVDMIIAQKPYFMGQEGFNCAIGAMNGETYEPYINPGISMITPDNYKEFQT